jgi:hypothetical protein
VLNGGGGGVVQGTAVISNWSSTTTDAATTALIATKVANHEAAGFSTDIVSYCYTGHTESVAAGAMGAIAQAGGYGGTTPPKVLDLKWGRFGWNSGSHSYSNTNTLAAPSASPGFSNPTNADCTGSTPDSELVRCTAAAALTRIGSGFTAGATTGYAGKQVIDIRPGSVGSNSVGNSAVTYQVPLNTVFNTGLNDINPAGGEVLAANRTQHTAGIVGVGLEMLGFDSNFSKWGLAEYNNTIGEQYTGGAGYGLVPNVLDNTAPVISGVSASPGASSATITWSTDEPATSMVEYGTTSGGPYTKVNDTILHTAHSVTLTGLTPGQTYYFVVSSYDGQANGSSAAESSFTTTCTSGMPSLVPMTPTAYWDSMAAYTAGDLSVDFPIANTGADDAYNVAITSSTPGGLVTLTSSMPASIGTITAGNTGHAVLHYTVPSGVASFFVNNTASADDQCGTGYTYP